MQVGITAVVTNQFSTFFPADVAVGADGNIIALQQFNPVRLFRIDVITGVRTAITGSLGFQALSVAVEADGNIIVAIFEDTTFNIPGKVLRVDPVTGVATTLVDFASPREGIPGDHPAGVAIEADGNILVSINSPPQILRIDPGTGAVTIVAEGAPFVILQHIAVEADKNIVAVDRVADAVFRVDPASGAITTVAQGLPFRNPSGIAVEADGDLMVSDFTTRSVFRVDAVTATVTTFAGGFFANFGIEVFQHLARQAVQVDIDIKPGSFPNSINQDNKGVIPVAILGSATFDATKVDGSSCTLGDAPVKTVGKSAKELCSVEDVSGDFSGGPEGAPDGFLDQVCKFVTIDLGAALGDTEAKVNCLLPEEIEGTDSIRIVPPE